MPALEDNITLHNSWRAFFDFFLVNADQL